MSVLRQYDVIDLVRRPFDRIAQSVEEWSAHIARFALTLMSHVQVTCCRGINVIHDAVKNSKSIMHSA